MSLIGTRSGNKKKTKGQNTPLKEPNPEIQTKRDVSGDGHDEGQSSDTSAKGAGGDLDLAMRMTVLERALQRILNKMDQEDEAKNAERSHESKPKSTCYGKP